MCKLLRAHFYRLRRSRALWLCMAAAFALSALFQLRIGADNESMNTLDVIFLQVFPFLPILHAAFISLFLGVEYQDGTLRNKLIAGHSRGTVYAAYLLVSIAGCFAILLAWMASAVIGVVKFGWFAAPAEVLLLNAVTILLLTAALAAFLTLLCLLIPNRAVSAVAAILLMFGLIVVGSVFYNALCEPEMASAAVMTANGFEVGGRSPTPIMSPVRCGRCISLSWTHCPPGRRSCWSIRSWRIRRFPCAPLWASCCCPVLWVWPFSNARI